MKRPALIPITLLLILSPLARADRFAPPPEFYRAECGSCHVAYPAELLTAEDWRRVLATLDRHYGSDASVEGATRARIEEYLYARAGNRFKPGTAQTDPPRLTRTPWFERKHREVATRDWNSPRVKTPANCGACHRRAETGSFREGEIVMPDGRRYEED
ncbi:diheme cytochrome c [Pelomicrobium methylotrophicum]|nr:diheme cytochrome c [Pelomicrobium methylotrophicum]